MKARPLLRATFALAALGAAGVAVNACSSQGTTPTESGVGASEERLVVCSPPTVKHCTDEGLGGSTVCSCVKTPDCIAGGVAVPAALAAYSCSPGISVSPGITVWACNKPPSVPTTIYGGNEIVLEWVAASGIPYSSCGSPDDSNPATGSVCTYDPAWLSTGNMDGTTCIPPIPSGRVYISTRQAPPDGGGGGCSGPCALQWH